MRRIRVRRRGQQRVPDGLQRVPDGLRADRERGGVSRGVPLGGQCSAVFGLRGDQIGPAAGMLLHGSQPRPGILQHAPGRSRRFLLPLAMRYRHHRCAAARAPGAHAEAPACSKVRAAAGVVLCTCAIWCALCGVARVHGAGAGSARCAVRRVTVGRCCMGTAQYCSVLHSTQRRTTLPSSGTLREGEALNGAYLRAVRGTLRSMVLYGTRRVL